MDHLGGPHLLMEFARAGVSNQASPVAGSSTMHSPNRSTPDGAGRKRPREDGSSGEDGEGEEDHDMKPLGAGGDQQGGSAQMQRSCEECKRRKVKCDRLVPCGNCRRRGTSASCSAESTKPRPPRRTNYALASDVERLTQRLVEVEKMLKIRPNPSPNTSVSTTTTPQSHLQQQHPNPHLPRRAPSDLSHSNPATPSVLQQPHRDSPAAVGSAEHEVDELDSDPDLSNLERAATTLEAAAYDSRGGATHRAVDSLPFFDNLTSYNQVGASVLRLKRNGDGPEELELTSGFTSILASPIDSWWSCAAEMGLDLLFTKEEDIALARGRALAEVLKLLPRKEDSFALVKRYFADSPSWMLNSAYAVFFLPEHERFWEMVEQGRQLEVDCLWLSVLFMIYALSCGGGFRNEQPISESYAGPHSSVFYGAARRLLHLGDWSGAPRVRTIQSVVLMCQWVQTASFGGEAGRLLTWLAGAVRVAQALGLHQLGEDPEIMPPDDRAWPPGKNARKRQMALRLFSSLRLVDYSTSSRYRAYLLNSNHITTAPIDNIDLTAASPTDWQLQPVPRDVITDASFEFAKWRMIEAALQVFETLTNKSTFSYDQILRLDAHYRAVLSELPSVWQPVPPGAPLGTPEMRWKRHACQEAIHNRLARLHRPFLTKGFQEGSPYRFSSEECVASARVVISSHHQIMDVTNTMWFSYSHALTAALILFADLFNAIDTGLAAAELDKRSEFLVLASVIFSRYHEIESSILRGVAQQGAKVISGLFMAEQKRRHIRDNGAGPPPETFAQILQQITRDLDPKSPSQPTSKLEEPLQATTANRLAPFTSAQVYPPQTHQPPPAQASSIYPPAPSTPYTGPVVPLPPQQQQPPSQPSAPFPNYDPNLAPFGAAPSQQGLNGSNYYPGTYDPTYTEGMFDWSWLDVGGDGSLLAGAGIDGGAMAGVSQFDEVLSGW